VSEADADLRGWMERYQQADPVAPGVLIAALSPGLLRFFRVLDAGARQAEDLLQDTWLRIHKARHSYRATEPVLPWVYAIARRVRIDHYRRNRRTMAHEVAVGDVPEPGGRAGWASGVTNFETLVGILPENEREVITLLKAGDLSLEEVARATGSTVGAVKQKAHRAYRRLRKVLENQVPAGVSPGGRES